MSISSRNRAPSASTLSLNNASASRASRRPPPPLAKVVTVPPWARDEPPSPKEQTGSPTDAIQPAPQSHASDAASLQTTTDDHSRWWGFTSRYRDHYQGLHSHPGPRSERKGFRDRSISWLQASTSLREGMSSSGRKDKEKERDLENGDRPPPLSIPEHPTSTYNPSAVNTPSWYMPWSAKLAAQGPHPQYQDSYDSGQEDRVSSPEPTRESGWAARRKRVRSFILTNAYVPLLFRFINISFTTAALGMAIHIRQIELANHAMGAVGSSPTVVIIFAPLTLVHVMAAIYLEYFGRPLGLWRTSGKLAHTLSEVLFICAWSAALSLSFDNFFTSLVPCASPSSLSWYNELPRDFDFPVLEGNIGREICDSQLALICLVGVGLIAYCTNLIISLYRIFEKVKYHPAARTG
ncbi:hypothetical protein CC1G_06801 [Coprinopsis cinerea okayama7|uniref:Uncharacterized protein n=1 Tax=Coprinopsis cinerea (strain Okayama-7 / 130 / ATCC MYA-4618 / FGSC 9003) TaxID=240176 RepID=A8N1S3_COPC7|nr:hypothetical protein CC1G_06801 [Coprinopsis cinerea okayama7\|eukprot:XP_001828815.2 hypothetical protein CC1G_06801 [Coprinopsis cinerea okayama7\